MRNFGWSDFWLGLLSLFAVAVASLFGYATFQDHSVQFYYVSSHGMASGRNGYCIDGYRNWWANDSGVFCSDDVQKTVAVLKELNDALALRKGGNR